MKFRDMGISDRTIAALEEMGYVDATEVQEKTIPLIMNGKEVVVRSQTGTGKTAAFGIGLIEMIAKDKHKKALVLVPTRELALQITKEIRSIAKNHRMRIYAIYGGQDIKSQFDLLERGFEIVVATPGRLLDHTRRESIDLAEFNLIVLDEADRMLDMGFKEDIDEILDMTNTKKQMMLFSATIDSQIRSIARNYMESAETVEIGAEGKVETIDEEFVHLTRREKIDKLRDILKREPVSRTIIFVATQKSAEYVCHKLNADRLDARYLHGGKSQNQRERVMRDFREGDFRILVATDVVARGLHVEEISHIISYDQANSADTHTHRIGRTGRMGKKGKAITFVETDAHLRPSYGNGGHRGSYGRSNHRRDYRRDDRGGYSTPRKRHGYDPYKSVDKR